MAITVSGAAESQRPAYLEMEEGIEEKEYLTGLITEDLEGL